MNRRSSMILSILALCALACSCQDAKPAPAGAAPASAAPDGSAAISTERELEQLSATVRLTDQQQARTRAILDVARRARDIALRQPDARTRAAGLARLRTQVQRALSAVVPEVQAAQVDAFVASSPLFRPS